MCWARWPLSRRDGAYPCPRIGQPGSTNPTPKRSSWRSVVASAEELPTAASRGSRRRPKLPQKSCVPFLLQSSRHTPCAVRLRCHPTRCNLQITECHDTGDNHVSLSYGTRSVPATLVFPGYGTRSVAATLVFPGYGTRSVPATLGEDQRPGRADSFIQAVFVWASRVYPGVGPQNGTNCPKWTNV